MAIGTPTERYAVSRATQAASTTFSPTGTINVGSFLVLATTATIASKVPTTVTDDGASGGNTWAVDATYNVAVGATFALAFSSCQVTKQLTSSNVITVNWGASNNNQVHLWLQEVTGIISASAFDKTATGHGEASTGTMATAATAALAQANEIVFGVFRSEGITGWAKGASYTDPTTLILGAPASALEYKIVAATTAVTADGTQTSTTNDYAALLATYKAAAAAAVFVPRITMTLN